MYSYICENVHRNAVLYLYVHGINAIEDKLKLYVMCAYSEPSHTHTPTV